MTLNKTEQSDAPGGDRNGDINSQQASNEVRGDHWSSSIPQIAPVAPVFNEERPFISSTINNFTGVSDRLEEEFAEAELERTRLTFPPAQATVTEDQQPSLHRPFLQSTSGQFAPCPTPAPQTSTNASAHTIPPAQAPSLNLNQLSQSDMERLRYLFEPPTENFPTASAHKPSGSISQFKRRQQSTSSATSTAELFASTFRVLKACFAGLRNTLVLFSIYIAFILPYLMPLLAQIAVPFLTLILIKFLAAQALHTACSNGLAHLTPLGARILNTSDICIIPVQTSTSLVLGDDPTGITTVATWTDASKELIAARKGLVQMSYGVTLLVASTKTWQDVILDGTAIHSLATDYSAAHKAARDAIGEVLPSHISFIGSVAFDARILSSNINRMLSNYGTIS